MTDAVHRLKIKIGPHEFEAEGTEEAVQQQFEAFKQLIALAPDTPPTRGAQPARNGEGEAPQETTQLARALSKIMRTDGRIVSLTVRPEGIYEAILLVLFGQKELRQNDSVSGAEIMDGLKSTGGFSVARVDGFLEYLARDGEVIIIGEHRAKRYRLTNAGYTRAAQLVDAALKIIP